MIGSSRGHPWTTQNLFRKAAIERLQSPDQLNQLVDVASPRAWISLIALCALLGVGIVWSVVGVLPTKKSTPRAS